MRFSAVLLAGGNSSRMGRDKALLRVDGQLLWRRQLETLRGLAPNELFLAGPQRDPAAETIADALTNAGPLAGLTATLRRSTSPHLVVLALDLPLMTRTFLNSLLQLGQEGRGVVPQREGRFEPMAAVYPQSSLALAEDALQRGALSMQDFVRAAIKQDLLLAREITAEEMALFTNLNTPTDFAAL